MPQSKQKGANETETEDLRERAVLVAVVRDNQDARQTDEYLDELEFLAETGGCHKRKWAA